MTTLTRPSEPIVERIARTTYRADWIGLIRPIDRLAQTADVNVDGALVDINFRAPDAVEQLLAREHAPRPLHQKLEQAVLGRPELDRPAATRHALLLAVELQVADR